MAAGKRTAAAGGVKGAETAIRAELKRRAAVTAEEVVAKATRGRCTEAFEDLLFFMAPDRALAALEQVRREVASCARTQDTDGRAQAALFLTRLAVALTSYLPRWNLQDAERYGKQALRDDTLVAEARATGTVATGIASDVPEAGALALERLRAETSTRFAAEGVADSKALAADYVGGTLDHYRARIEAEIAGSTLRRIAELRREGGTVTEIGNDYAAFADHAMLLGASFATTNPPLIDMAWQTLPERWDPAVARLIAQNPGATPEALARLVTLEIALESMRALRPVFLLSAGAMGRVCVQVDPASHGDAAKMVEEARALFALLRERLGGEPNVLFKLPGTQAGCDACRALTAQGIGVTITLNFGMFQHLPFVQTISAGTAQYSCVVEMSGRLAFPVRDELLARADQLRARGIGEAQIREAAAWAGVAVVKRLQRRLVQDRVDLSRVRPLVASLRVYAGETFKGLPDPHLDITEALGARIISVFPNVRRSIDSAPGTVLDGARVDRPVPEEALAVLAESEIFRQAYYDPALDGGDGRFRPARPLALGDTAAVAAWKPVADTLKQFCDTRAAFTARIAERQSAAR